MALGNGEREVPPIRPRVSEWRDFEDDLLDVLIDPMLSDLVEATEKTGADWEDLWETIRALEVDPELLAEKGQAAAERNLQKVRRRHTDEFWNKMSRQFGVDVRPLMPDSAIEEVMRKAVADSASLATSGPGTFRDRLIKTMTQLTEDAPFDQKIAKDVLKQSYGFTGNSLRRIVRDQNNKLIGALTEVRQTQLGIEEYIWSSSLDARVRPTHRNNHGRRFRWDTPPPTTGNPGTAILCRCTASAVISRELRQQVRESAQQDDPADGQVLHTGGWQKVGPQAGSNPGGLYRDLQGREHYVKFIGDERAGTEALAARLYQSAGVNMPRLRLIEMDGRRGLASEIIQGPLVSSSRINPLALNEAREGFVADAWLANWDVVGDDFDNLLWGPGNRAVRVDTGGALTFRAQGARKGSLFGDRVDELDSLRDASIDRQAADIFGEITEEQLRDGAVRVAAITDDEIREAVQAFGLGDDLADTLIARRNDIKKRVLGIEPVEGLEELVEEAVEEATEEAVEEVVEEIREVDVPDGRLNEEFDDIKSIFDDDAARFGQHLEEVGPEAERIRELGEFSDLDREDAVYAYAVSASYHLSDRFYGSSEAYSRWKYAGVSYQRFNSKMRQGLDLDDAEKALNKGLDALSAPIKESTRLWRVETGNVADIKVGDVVPATAWSSTSPDLTYSSKFGIDHEPVRLWDIRAPTGTPAVITDSGGIEYILPPGTQFRILDVEDVDWSLEATGYAGRRTNIGQRVVAEIVPVDEVADDAAEALETARRATRRSVQRQREVARLELELEKKRTAELYASLREGGRGAPD